MATNRRIAILGAGKIGESLLAGLLSSGWRKPADIIVTGRREERLQELTERHGVEATLDNAAAVADAGMIVIAVKPQDFDVLLGEVGGLITGEQTVLSVAAAIPTSQIEARLAPGVPVVRAMPNAPALVHEGIAGICAGAHADEAHLDLAEEVLTHLGAVARVPETYMDAVTAVSGSGARRRPSSSCRRCLARRSCYGTRRCIPWSSARRSPPPAARRFARSASWNRQACAQRS